MGCLAGGRQASGLSCGVCATGFPQIILLMVTPIGFEAHAPGMHAKGMMLKITPFTAHSSAAAVYQLHIIAVIFQRGEDGGLFQQRFINT